MNELFLFQTFLANQYQMNVDSNFVMILHHINTRNSLLLQSACLRNDCFDFKVVNSKLNSAIDVTDVLDLIVHFHIEDFFFRGRGWTVVIKCEFVFISFDFSFGIWHPEQKLLHNKKHWEKTSSASMHERDSSNLALVGRILIRMPFNIDIV